MFQYVLVKIWKEFLAHLGMSFKMSHHKTTEIFKVLAQFFKTFEEE